MKKEQLKPFCSTFLSHLCEPFSHGNYTYATDGKMIIRVARVDGVDENPSAPSENGINDVMQQFVEGTATEYIPAFPPVVREVCACCGGNGISDWDECQECEKGTVTKWEVVQIGARKIKNIFLEKIATLPSARISSTGESLTGCSFVFDGGIGIVMPVRDGGVL